MLLDQRQRAPHRFADLEAQQRRHPPGLGPHDVGHAGDGGVEQVVVAHPGVVVDLAQVALARVGEQHHHQVVGAERERHLDRDPGRHARRAAHEHRLLACQPSRHVETVAVVAGDHPVDDLEVGGGRDEVLAHPFDLVGVGLGHLPGLVIGLEDRAHGIGAHHLNRGLLLFEESPGAADRAAGAHAGHEVGDLTAALLPQLGAGGLVVSLRVGGVAVLIGEEGSGALARDAPRHRVVALRRFGGHRGGRQLDLGPVRLEQVDLLDRDLVGHAEHRMVAADRGHHRQTHAGVARRALDDGAARLEAPGAHRGLDHREPDPVLHAATRVEGFELRQHRARTAAGHAVEPDQRGAADGGEDVVLVLDAVENAAHGRAPNDARRNAGPRTGRRSGAVRRRLISWSIWRSAAAAPSPCARGRHRA